MVLRTTFGPLPSSVDGHDRVHATFLLAGGPMPVSLSSLSPRYLSFCLSSSLLVSISVSRPVSLSRSQPLSASLCHTVCALISVFLRLSLCLCVCPNIHSATLSPSLPVCLCRRLINSSPVSPYLRPIASADPLSLRPCHFCAVTSLPSCSRALGPTADPPDSALLSMCANCVRNAAQRHYAGRHGQAPSCENGKHRTNDGSRSDLRWRHHAQPRQDSGLRWRCCGNGGPDQLHRGRRASLPSS